MKKEISNEKFEQIWIYPDDLVGFLRLVYARFFDFKNTFTLKFCRNAMN